MKGDKINCENEKCGKVFVKTYNRSRFCCRACSNAGIKRRKKRITLCEYCGDEVDYYTNKFCKSCIGEGRHNARNRGGKLLSEMTIAEASPRSGANSYDNIRSAARLIMRELLSGGCESCGYQHHVHVCHVKGIAEFDRDTTLVSEVNSRSNLRLLCPNCHWELDNL